jgi:hypothetical protein
MTAILLWLALAVYVLGVGAFGGMYIVNGLMLAWDERPWWMALIQTVGWPIHVPIQLLASSLRGDS